MVDYFNLAPTKSVAFGLTAEGDPAEVRVVGDAFLDVVAISGAISGASGGRCCKRRRRTGRGGATCSGG